jgi:hypothetical protein
MGAVHLNGPAEARTACPFCLMAAKQLQWEMYADEIKAGYEASGEKVTWIPWPEVLDKQLQDGRYRAVPGDAPALGMTDGLCWDHVAGVHEGPAAPGQQLVVPSGPLPPSALRRG